MNRQEYEALEGLPHIAMLMYSFSLRKRMDYTTGIVGETYRITWRKISEDLEVIGAPGIKAVRFTRRMLERAAAHLVKVGLISFETVTGTRQLIFKCLKATSDQSAQNKVVHKWCETGETQKHHETSETPTHTEESKSKPEITTTAKSGAISDHPFISECVSDSESSSRKFHTYFRFLVKDNTFTTDELIENIEEYIDYCADLDAKPTIVGCRKLLRSRAEFKANRSRIRKAANELAVSRTQKLEALARKEEETEDRIHSETIYRRSNPVPDYSGSPRHGYTSRKNNPTETPSERVRREAAEYLQSQGIDDYKIAS